MWARSTTIHGDPQMIDDGIAYVRDTVMPAVQEMSGCVGMSLLCDRESGRCIATTAWADEEAMHATESMVYDMRQRAAEMFGGRPEVREWEIAIMHRLHETPEGASCRVIWASGDADRMDDMLGTFRMGLLPRMEELPGFCSTSVLVDRRTGDTATAVVYESRDAMMRATEQGRSMRTEFAEQTHGSITEVAEFEVALAHLRVPETV